MVIGSERTTGGGTELFLSYRRSDQEFLVGRLRDLLVEYMGPGTVFYDVDSATPGDDIRTTIRKAIESSAIVLAVIGPQWESRRLSDANDFVCAELTLALSVGVPVLPVLINDASMPSPHELPPRLDELSYVMAFRIRRDPDFRSDVRSLAYFLREREVAARQSPTIVAAHDSLPIGLNDGHVVLLRSTKSGPLTGRALARGVPASGGLAKGLMYVNADHALDAVQLGQPTVLLLNEASPDVIPIAIQMNGLVATRGGLVSHAAVFARGMGIPAIVGAEHLRLAANGFYIADRMIVEGTLGIVDGDSGYLFTVSEPNPGWYPDPFVESDERYWEGAWSQDVRGKGSK